jgi:hypothetical protein
MNLRLYLASYFPSSMVEYPYVTTTNALQKFISQIPDTGIPGKLTINELEKRGFKSTNHRLIISVMKFLKFIDELQRPTERWKSYRDKSRNKRVIAQAVKEAYADLFSLYPNAQERDTEALKNFFSTRTAAGSQVVDKTVATFKVLCQLSDFGEETLPEASPKQERKQAPSSSIKNNSQTAQEGKVPAININIQLQLPVTDNAEIYDKIFEALKKYLLT